MIVAKFNEWLEWLFQYEHRRILYVLVTVVGPLAVAYGLVTEENYAVILGVVSGFAGTAVAAYNTPAGGRMLPEGGERVPRPGSVSVVPGAVSDNSVGDHVVVGDGDDRGVVE